MLEVGGCLGSEKEINMGEIGEMYKFGQVYEVNEWKEIQKCMGMSTSYKKNISVYKTKRRKKYRHKNMSWDYAIKEKKSWKD